MVVGEDGEGVGSVREAGRSEEMMRDEEVSGWRQGCGASAWHPNAVAAVAPGLSMCEEEEKVMEEGARKWKREGRRERDSIVCRRRRRVWRGDMSGECGSGGGEGGDGRRC